VREGPENKMGEAGSLAQKGHRGVPRGKMRGIPPKVEHDKSAADLVPAKSEQCKKQFGAAGNRGYPGREVLRP